MLKAFVKKSTYNYEKVLEFLKAKQPQIKLEKGLGTFKGYWVVTYRNLASPKLFFNNWYINCDYADFNRRTNFLASELENRVFELKVLINDGDIDKLPDLLDAFMALGDLIADKALKATAKNKNITLTISKWELDKSRFSEWKDDPTPVWLIRAWDKNKVIGHATFYEDWGMVEDILVLPKYRRKGIATRIYNAIEKRFKIKLHPSSNLEDGW